ncbi:uncharacterized protein N0V89_009187 [Didymosphaeria variabile]|uniref:Azaphilone pigments biosynthesis cluster protein L N-terminal domain-containing protein n=1 Tax=Didymosphaeria variabile TaxID=1932322 RepID=A0A9W9C6B6_9PLEO|nr:uncharacterized protein N0V89_009187 [Didymosphaeria variabile]KAJ4347817.1 hypothetical protein N0V89_009187 [Didymosphaeria variabile]
MDPLSIGSAVVGLIAAAARMAPMLHHFVVHTRDAPKSASQILDEMNSITSALERLQVYLMGAYKTNAARRSMLSLRNIVATLTACVTTYSDLEHVVKKCVDDGKVKKFKWTMNEGDVGELLGRAQAHKLSLVFMLTILQCESMQEAEDHMHRLVELVEGLVDSNMDLRNRLDAIAADHASTEAAAPHLPIASTLTTIPLVSQQPFEEDLSSSRVYRNLRPRDSIYSLNSSQRASLALSAFSDLSLGNVSVISVLCLPVWSVDLMNAEHYRFGREGLTLTMAELTERYPYIEFPDPDSLDEMDVQVESGGHGIPSQPASLPSSNVFNSALPISTSPSTVETPLNGSDLDEPEVLFLAASLFDFNISHDRREGGIPYLIYVPGEIFDVIGMKGELWLARNQDDPQRIIGWIWEKHFARMVPDDSKKDSGDDPIEVTYNKPRYTDVVEATRGTNALIDRSTSATEGRARSEKLEDENEVSVQDPEFSTGLSISGPSASQFRDRSLINYRGRFVNQFAEGLDQDDSTRPLRRRRWYHRI